VNMARRLGAHPAPEWVLYRVDGASGTLRSPVFV